MEDKAEKKIPRVEFNGENHSLDNEYINDY